MPLKASDDVNLRDRLQTGLEQLGLSFDDHQVSQLLRYIALLEQWNVAYNLTAVKDPQEMIDLHILDSLAVAKYLHAENILDVGSGAGLPGIPL
ncbi:MAG TPA: 16S rRNA (guanine(527)-N(7))-methyltransferase RsmG, partial [Porticoccaceae bacterium]|nr:16S rRNA (guanine(527)-N(7))-methyltransferase RsmG [Porticoccaceae bacterium]